MDKKGQSIMEFGILLLVIAASVIAMQTYLKRGIQGRLREGVDSIGEQYDPAVTTSDFSMERFTNRTTTTNSQTQLQWVGSFWDGWAWQDIYRNVEVVTQVQQVHYDNVERQGSENVPKP